MTREINREDVHINMTTRTSHECSIISQRPGGQFSKHGHRTQFASPPLYIKVIRNTAGTAAADKAQSDRPAKRPPVGSPARRINFVIVTEAKWRVCESVPVCACNWIMSE